MADTQKNNLFDQASGKENLEIRDEKVSVLDLAAVLWKRKRMILLLTFSAAIVSLAIAALSIVLPPEKGFMPNVYTPEALMMIQSDSADSGLSDALSSSGLGGLADLAGLGKANSTYGNLAVALANSNSTLDALNEKFGITERLKIEKQVVSRTRDALRSKLAAKIDETSGLFKVSYTDIDPVLARDVVNETVRILEARFATLSGNRALQQKELLEKKLGEIDMAIKELEANVRAFQDKYGVVQVDALVTEQISLLAKLRSELIMKEIEISNYQTITIAEDPTTLQLKREKEIILSKIKEIETGKGSGTRVMPSQRELPGIAFEYSRMERELLVQVELLKIVTQQYELTKLKAAGQEPIFQIVEMAEVPDRKSGPARSKMCVLITAAVFFASLFLAFVAEWLEKVRSDKALMLRFKALSSRRRPS